MDTPEGFVPQEQHDAAMLALRAEFEEAANIRQGEINGLKTQLEIQASQFAEQFKDLGDDRDQIREDRDQWKDKATGANTDNAGLRNALASYLQNTTTGTAIVMEFRRWLLESQAKLIQDQLSKLG